ncbi:MAG: NAD-dependent epimerase/dehydratase family protein [Pseudomonadota bacterium]
MVTNPWVIRGREVGVSLMDLVTGGAGFVGKRLVSTLAEYGRPVRVLDTVSCQTAYEKGASPTEYIAGSITNKTDAELACERVETVFHLAGIADLWRPNPADFDHVNHHGTCTMLKAAKTAGVTTFVHCSSATTFIGTKTPIGPSIVDETSAIPVEQGLGAYPKSKILAERAAIEASTAYRKSSDMRVVIVNPTEPLGPGDESLTPPTKMILDFVNQKTPASLDCMLNFVSLHDLAEGFIAAAERGGNGERYLLAGDNTSMADLLSLTARLSNVSMPKAKVPYLLALLIGVIDTKLIAPLTRRPPTAPLTGVRLAGRRVSFDASKAAQELAWKAAPIEPALVEMLDWARSKQLIA